MAQALKYNAYRGHKVPGIPNTDHDDQRVEKEARLRGMEPEEYVAQALAFRYPDGSSPFTLASHAGQKFPAAKTKAEEIRSKSTEPAPDQPAEQSTEETPRKGG